MADEKIVMGAVVGITDDLQCVTVELLKNGEALGWVAFSPEQVDQHVANLLKYKGLLRPAEPAKPALNS